MNKETVPRHEPLLGADATLAIPVDGREGFWGPDWVRTLLGVFGLYALAFVGLASLHPGSGSVRLPSRSQA